MPGLGKLAGGAAVAGAVLLGSSGVAFAAGGGYGGAPTAPGGTGSFSTVVSVKNISGAAGGTATAVVDGAKVSFNIPAGDFSGTVQAVFSAGDLTTIGTGGFGGKAVTAFAIQVDHDGHKLPGPFKFPLTVTVTDGGITTTSVVYVEVGTTFERASSWTVTAGEAKGSITADPDFLIDTPAPSAVPVGAAIPGATTATTGKPFFGEGLLAAGLAAIGGFGAFRWRRQRRRVAV